MRGFGAVRRCTRTVNGAVLTDETVGGIRGINCTTLTANSGTYRRIGSFTGGGRLALGATGLCLSLGLHGLALLSVAAKGGARSLVYKEARSGTRSLCSDVTDRSRGKTEGQCFVRTVGTVLTRGSDPAPRRLGGTVDGLSPASVTAVRAADDSCGRGRVSSVLAGALVHVGSRASVATTWEGGW